MIKYIYLSFLVTAIAHFGAQANDIPKKYGSGGERRDFATPYDIAPNDALELPEIRYFMERPAALSRDLLDDVQGFRQTLSKFQSGLKPDAYEMPASLVDKQLGLRLDTAIGFIPAKLLREYAGSLISFTTMLDKDPMRAQSRALYYASTAAPIAARALNPYAYSSIYEYEAALGKSRDSLNRLYSALTDIQNGNIPRIGMQFFASLLNIAASNARIKELLDETITTKIINTKYGRIAIGGKGDDVYKGAFTLIIDIGGNDKYELSSGKLSSLYAIPARAIVDFSGDDIYTGDDFAIAGAYFGVSALIDFSGNDSYAGGNFTQAASIGGFAILRDFKGNDKYKCDFFGQGFAAFGEAALIDDEGNDVYVAQAFSQAVGATAGKGYLMDAAGDDRYTAEIVDSKGSFPAYYNFSQGAGAGLRGGAGGKGLLADLAGNDTYIAQGFSQGASRSKSLGALVDLAGNDTYSSNYFSQGAADDFSVAALVDQTGNDSYTSQINSVGFARGVSTAEFNDASGADAYIADSLSFGAGSSNSIVFVTDTSGKNEVETNNVVEKNYSRMFLRYEGAKFISRAFLGGEAETFGAQKSGGSPARAISPAKRLRPSVKTALPTGADSLFLLAAYAYDVAPELAENAIVKLRLKLDANAPALYKYFPSIPFATRSALYDVFAGNGGKSPEVVAQVLLDSLKSRSFFTRSLAAEALTRDRDERLITELDDMIDDGADWRFRALAARSYGELRDRAAISALASASRDAHPLVRANALNSIGKLNFERLSFFVKPALSDSSKLVRETAQSLMQNMETDDVSDIIALLRNGASYENELRYYAKLSNLVRNKGDFAEFLNYIKTQDEAKRKMIYESIAAGKNKFWKTHLPSLVKNEDDPALKEMLGRIKF